MHRLFIGNVISLLLNPTFVFVKYLFVYLISTQSTYFLISTQSTYFLIPLKVSGAAGVTLCTIWW